MSKPQHLQECRAIWQTVTMLREHRKVGWDRFARESFELVRVALIYQRNALAMYDESELHGLLRPPASGVVIPAPWPSSDDPLFPNLMSTPDVRLGGVFLASASFRLPVAVLKAVELSARAFEEGDVRLLEREPEWKRGTISSLFGGLKALKCCKTRPLGKDLQGKLRNAIAIAVIQRDEFGHGELGQPATDGAYKKDRERVLDSLYVCRILQAQRELCQWALARLAEER